MKASEGIAQPREAKTIQRARERLGISQREAASRAGISPSQWRYIETGYRYGPQGLVAVHGRPAMVARMATAVELLPEHLVKYRPDVAREMWYFRAGAIRVTDASMVVGLLIDLRDLFGEDVFNEALGRFVKVTAKEVAR